MAKDPSDPIPRTFQTTYAKILSSGPGYFPSPLITGSYAGAFPSSDAVPDLIQRWDDATKDKDEQEVSTEEWAELKREYLKHLTWRFSYPQAVFRQQIATAWAVTGLVFLLILSGLGFSIYQLLVAIRLGDLTTLSSELAIETAGRLSISSSVVGLLVLLISLAFFYLFIRHVYGVRHPIPPHVSLRETDAQLLAAADEGPSSS